MKKNTIKTNEIISISMKTIFINNTNFNKLMRYLIKGFKK